MQHAVELGARTMPWPLQHRDDYNLVAAPLLLLCAFSPFHYHFLTLPILRNQLNASLLILPCQLHSPDFFLTSRHAMLVQASQMHVKLCACHSLAMHFVSFVGSNYEAPTCTVLCSG